MSEFRSLKRGDGFYVRFGSRGAQYAIVSRPENLGYVLAFKYSERSKKWTKRPIKVMESEFVCRSVAPKGAVNRPIISNFGDFK